MYSVAGWLANLLLGWTGAGEKDTSSPRGQSWQFMKAGCGEHTPGLHELIKKKKKAAAGRNKSGQFGR